MSKLVEAARFSNSLDAGVARSRLEADGLHCMLFDSGFSGVEAVGLFIPVRLMVLDEDLEEARAVLGKTGSTKPFVIPAEAEISLGETYGTLHPLRSRLSPG